MEKELKPLCVGKLTICHVLWNLFLLKKMTLKYIYFLLTYNLIMPWQFVYAVGNANCMH